MYRSMSEIRFVVKKFTNGDGMKNVTIGMPVSTCQPLTHNEVLTILNTLQWCDDLPVGNRPKAWFWGDGWMHGEGMFYNKY